MHSKPHPKPRRPGLVPAALSLLGAGAVALALGGCKSVHTTLDIDAPADVVWDVLADLDAYPEWNPYHVRVEGEPTVGAPLVVDIHKPNGHQLTIEPHVIEVVPARRLVWGGGIRGLFVGEHVFALEPLGADRTRLVQSEEFHGVFVPFARLAAIEEGYELVNRAVRDRAEAAARR